MIEDHWMSLVTLAVVIIIALYLKQFPKMLAKETGKLRAEISSVSSRLDADIKEIRDSVVFKDVFEQHEKVEDARYDATQQMHAVLTEQLKASSTANKDEHGRICGKLDGLVNIIMEKNS